MTTSRIRNALVELGIVLGIVVLAGVSLAVGNTAGEYGVLAALASTIVVTVATAGVLAGVCGEFTGVNNSIAVMFGCLTAFSALVRLGHSTLAWVAVAGMAVFWLVAVRLDSRQQDEPSDHSTQMNSEVQV